MFCVSVAHIHPTKDSMLVTVAGKASESDDTLDILHVAVLARTLNNAGVIMEG